MLWLKKRGAAHSAAFQNVHDAAILWFVYEPSCQVDATVVRQGTVAQLSTTDPESVERARAVAEGQPWVPVASDAKWMKFVNVDRMTDVVLQEDPAPGSGSTRGARKLVLSVMYVAPDKPFQPQTYVCGEVHEGGVIDYVLERIGHQTARKEERKEETVIVVDLPAPARPARPARPKKARA